MNWTVGALAEAAGVGIETIRYYERRGLLPEPPRRASGYRQYAPGDVTRVLFIKRAQALGFTLKEIGELIRLEQDTRSECGDVQERARQKVQLIEQKLEELARMRTELLRLTDCCESDRPLADCQLMNCLAGTP